ncbi:hypothetical protein GQ457_04G021240 [Hibiscus cannabinus]
MATNFSSFAEGLPSRFSNAAIREHYYNIVANKNGWEEQGFMFDDGLENYGLEPIIYKRLNDLGWLRFGRQPAKANLNWVREFYAHNAVGNDTVNVRRRRVPANSTMINNLLDLPNNNPSIYELIDILMPTFHNQTVNRTSLVLINAIITRYKFNVGDVIAK